MKNFPLPRIDKDLTLQKLLKKYCRLKPGEIWYDENGEHAVGCFDVNDTALQKKNDGQ